MLCHIQEFSKFRQILIVSALHTGKVEPSQLDREDILQKGRQKEGGHRYTYHRHHRCEIVGKAILLFCRCNTQRDGNDDLENKRDQAKREAVPNGVLKLLRNGDGPVPAVAPFAFYSALQPYKVTLYDAFVHAVLRVQICQPFRVALGRTGTGRQLTGLCLDEAHRHVIHQRINDEHDKEQNDHAVKQTFYCVFEHFVSLLSSIICFTATIV